MGEVISANFTKTGTAVLPLNACPIYEGSPTCHQLHQRVEAAKLENRAAVSAEYIRLCAAGVFMADELGDKTACGVQVHMNASAEDKATIELLAKEAFVPEGDIK